MRSTLNKFEHTWGFLGHCTEGLWTGAGSDGSLCSEFQCIMGYGHMGSNMNRMTNTTENINFHNFSPKLISQSFTF